MSAHISVRIPDDLMEAIHRHRMASGSSVATVVVEALRQYLDKGEALTKKPQALPSADLAHRLEAVEARLKAVESNCPTGVPQVSHKSVPQVSHSSATLCPTGVPQTVPQTSNEEVEPSPHSVPVLITREGLTSAQLAQRLSVDITSINLQVRQLSPEDFAEWCRKPKKSKRGIADPNGLGWRKVQPGSHRTVRFFPV